MMNKMPNPLGPDLGRIAKESKRFTESDVDSMSRIAKESERFSQSDVDTTTKRAKREKNGQGG